LKIYFTSKSNNVSRGSNKVYSKKQGKKKQTELVSYVLAAANNKKRAVLGNTIIATILVCNVIQALCWVIRNTIDIFKIR
jgi:hypothetical protein